MGHNPLEVPGIQTGNSKYASFLIRTHDPKQGHPVNTDHAYNAESLLNEVEKNRKCDYLPNIVADIIHCD